MNIGKFKKCIYRVASNYWLLGISIILFGINIALNISNTVFDNSNLIITFIGILATFVVIGNYAQVKDIERRFDEKINEATGILTRQNFLTGIRTLINECYIELEKLYLKAVLFNSENGNGADINKVNAVVDNAELALQKIRDFNASHGFIIRDDNIRNNIDNIINHFQEAIHKIKLQYAYSSNTTVERSDRINYWESNTEKYNRYLVNIR